MHIEISKLSRIGDASADMCDFDIGQLLVWESSLEGGPKFHNVGIIDAKKQSLFATYYADFISRFQKYPATENLLLMTTDGDVLCSAVGGSFEVLQDKLPVAGPFKESRSTVVDSNVRRLEDIAREYIKGRLDVLDPKITHIKRSEVESITDTFSHALAVEIAKNPGSLDELEWRDLERVLAEALRGIGFHVELTSGSKDGGKDLILTCTTRDGERSYYVEVKHWKIRGRVGEKYLNDFMRLVVREKQHGGLFLSTYGYSNQKLLLGLDCC